MRLLPNTEGAVTGDSNPANISPFFDPLVEERFQKTRFSVVGIIGLLLAHDIRQFRRIHCPATT